jgi:hypothetical protein
MLNACVSAPRNNCIALKPNELNGEKYFRLAENRPYEPGNGFADREMTLLIRKCLRRAGNDFADRETALPIGKRLC